MFAVREIANGNLSLWFNHKDENNIKNIIGSVMKKQQNEIQFFAIDDSIKAWLDESESNQVELIFEEDKVKVQKSTGEKIELQSF